MENVLLALAIIVATARLLGTLTERLGYQSLIGEISAGIILGPTLLGLIVVQDTSGNLTGLGTQLRTFADLGIFFLMFVVGMKMDVHASKKVTRGAVLVSLGGFIVPLAFGFYVGQMFGLAKLTSIVLGVSLSITAVAVAAELLEYSKLLRTRLGQTMIGASLLNDMLGLISLSVIISFASGAGHSPLIDAGDTLLKILLYIGAAAFAGIYLAPPLVDYAWHLKTKQLAFTVTTVLLLIFSIVAEYLGVGGIIGAFLAGVFVRHGIRHKKEAMVILNDFSALSYGFLTPLFFTWLGLILDVSAFSANMNLLGALIIATFPGKFVGSSIGYLVEFGDVREASVIGIGMNARAEFELVVATLALRASLLTTDLFSLLVLLTVVSAMITPVLFKYLRKNISLK